MKSYCFLYFNSFFMKNILQILFLFILIDSYAQVPAYFANDPKWICNEKQSGTLPDNCYYNYDFLCYRDGDTTIGAFTYNKFKKKGWVNEAGFCYSAPVFYDQYYAGFRQDNRKIFINVYGQDSLFVDYNLSIGDTLKPCYLMPYVHDMGDSNFIVQSIDSVLFPAGYFRKFNFNFYMGMDTIPYYLLEGVGVFSESGMSGIENMYLIIGQPFEWFSTINCYLQDDNSVYGSGSCNLNDFDFYLGVETLQKTPKKLVRVTDLLGREAQVNQSNRILIYTYDDGSSEKVFPVE